LPKSRKDSILKFSDQIADWLVELGYSHCFLVGGGNIMHLIESISNKITCVPVMHEVAAGIAAEYFNQTSKNKKAFALVTAGPGLTNIVTALAGAYLESHELLVIGGQAKTADLSRGQLRQRGIQEIDGVSIARPVSIISKLVDQTLTANEFCDLVGAGRNKRQGPVFLEIPLDVQARQTENSSFPIQSSSAASVKIPETIIRNIAIKIKRAQRPVILLGGGISRACARELRDILGSVDCPLMTTWNGADRIPSSQSNYFGRPNTWGQRYANMILQQSDFLVAIGTRLGLQQTGFNWQQFVPNGEIAHVDIDLAELEKGHPRVNYPIHGDADIFLMGLLENDLGFHREWMVYAEEIKKNFPLIEKSNKTRDGFVSPFEFAANLSDACLKSDVIIPCSSGGAFTTMMQAFQQKEGQLLATNKGLASMGYGLSGAIGAAIANPSERIILVEGDGGFAQNMQEIGTAAINNLNIKIFIFDDSGYASIRMTQKNYFGGRYVGCDTQTGLGMPNWEKLFAAWNVPVQKITRKFQDQTQFIDSFNARGVCAYIVPIDTEQSYFPKIMSRVTPSGEMESNPLHLMAPELTGEQVLKFLKFINI
jgi:acetolactate synthase-1/2/3 large subunit